MRGLFTLVTLFALSAPAAVRAGSSCIAFDTKWNLLAFGFNGKDYNAGTSDSWASGTPTDITATGRPPFNGQDTKCYLAEFFNAIYVLGADTSKASAIYIYDATAKSWSTQTVDAAGFDPSSSFGAVLDRDTNVIFALQKGELWQLRMQETVKSNGSTISWEDGGAAQEITTTNYDPVMALAQNHIHFFGVPNNPAGTASLFVIHFAFWQPGAQEYGDFPNTHGQATSFFLDGPVQEEMVFIPDDGSHTYIINDVSNTTQTVAGPPTVDANARYFASTTALVQLASSGSLSWFPFDPKNPSANAAAKWSPVQSLNTITGASAGSSGGSSASGSPSGSASAAGSKSSAKAGGPAGGSGPSGSTSGSAPNPSGTGAASREVAWGSSTVLALVGVAMALL